MKKKKLNYIPMLIFMILLGSGMELKAESYNRWRALDFRGNPRVIGRWWDPYNPNLLKGDYPLFPLLGNDVFVAATVVSDTQLVKRDGGLFQEQDGVLKDKQSADYLAKEILFLRGEIFWGDTVFQQRRLSFTVGQRYQSIKDLGRDELLFNPNKEEFIRNVPEPEVFINTFDEIDGLKNIKVVDNDGNVNKSEVIDFVVDEAFLEVLLWEGSRYYDFVSLFAGRLFLQTDRQGLIFSNFANGGLLNANLFRNRVQYQLGYAQLNAEFRDFKPNNGDKPDYLAFTNVTFQDLFYDGFGLALNYQYLHTELDRDLDVAYYGIELFGHIRRLELDTSVFLVDGQENFFRRVKNDPDIIILDKTPQPGAEGQLTVFTLDDQLDFSSEDKALEERNRKQKIYSVLFFTEFRIPFSWFVPRFGYVYADRDRKPQLEFRDATGQVEVIAEFEDEVQTGFDAVNPNFKKFGAGGSIILNERIDFGKTFFLFNSKEGNPNYLGDGVEIFNVGLDLKVTPKLFVALDLNRLEGGDENSATEGILTLNYKPFLNDNVVLTAAFARAEIEPNERPNLNGTNIVDDKTLHRIIFNLRVVF